MALVAGAAGDSKVRAIDGVVHDEGVLTRDVHAASLRGATNPSTLVPLKLFPQYGQPAYYPGPAVSSGRSTGQIIAAVVLLTLAVTAGLCCCCWLCCLAEAMECLYNLTCGLCGGQMNSTEQMMAAGLAGAAGGYMLAEMNQPYGMHNQPYGMYPQPGW